jgi:hypothetical protein
MPTDNRLLHAPSPVNLRRLVQVVAGMAIGVIIAMVIVFILQNTRHHSYYKYPMVMVSPSEVILPLLAAYCIGLLFCILRQSPSDKLQLFTIAFLTRIILGFILAYVYQHEDEVVIHETAKAHIVSHDKLDLTNGYIRIVSTLYSIFGANLLLPKILNTLLASILSFLLYDITYRCISSKKAARRALNFCIFLPPLMIYAPVNLKELPSTFLLVLTIWVLLVPRWHLWLRTGFALLMVVVTFFMRGAWALLPLGAIIIYLVLGDGVWQIRRLLSIRTVLVLAALAMILAFPLRSVVEGMIEYMAFRLFLGTYASSASLRTTESSVTRSLLDIERPWSLRNLAVQTLRAPFAPFPLWNLSEMEIREAIILLNSSTHYILMPFALIGLLTWWRQSSVMMLGIMEMALLTTISLSLMLGLSIDRHSIPHFGIVYILASMGVENCHRYKWMILGWIILAVTYIIVYNTLRL